jgi:hypothetical protein
MLAQAGTPATPGCILHLVGARAAWRELLAGAILIVLGLGAAYEYLRPMAAERRPGLSLKAAGDPPLTSPAGPGSRRVAAFFLAWSLAGLALVALGLYHL